MAPIKNVAIVGGSGNLGPAIVNAVVAAGFTVTAVTREESKATFPAGVTVKRVNLESKEALVSAFKGQDAIVSTIATAAVGVQALLVDAAVEAKVPRFIPSEFGINTDVAKSHKLGKLLGAKLVVADRLEKLSSEFSWFSYTRVVTGLFFDWGLKVGFLAIDLNSKTATIFDSGNEQFFVSNLDYIGKAIVGILKNPEKTADQLIQVASFNTSQNEVLEAVEAETGTKFQVTNVKTSDVEKRGDEKLVSGDHSVFVDYLIVYNFGDGQGHALKPEDDAASILGIGKEDLKASVKKVISGL